MLQKARLDMHAWFVTAVKGFVLAVFVLSGGVVASADPPSTAYIFPAGGQRGTAVDVRIGAYNFHDSAAFYLTGNGIKTPSRIEQIEELWFEGPLIRLPDSQRKEDYPKAYAARLIISADAKLGNRYWYASTSQGVTSRRKFVVGDLPEIVEQEIDGNPIATKVKLPVTINGRIFPREDIDIWTVDLKAGQTVTCEVNAARIGSPLDSRLEIRDPTGLQIAENVDALGIDSRVRFTARTTGTYKIRIHDVRFKGLRDYVYRLTMTAGPYLDGVFPLGGRRGSTIALRHFGAHVPTEPMSVVLPSNENSHYVYRPNIGGQFANSVVLALDDLPEFLEADDNNDLQHAQKVSFPGIANGRIERPGDVDYWAVEVKKGDQLLFDLKATRLGSPLDSVLTLFDSTGKLLKTADDLGRGNTDSQLSYKFPTDGMYVIRVEERIPSRGGELFAYRLAISKSVVKPDFQLTFASDAITVNQGGESKFKIDVLRLGGFKEEIELKFQNLPEGVTVTGTKIAKNRNNIQVVFTAAKSTKLQIVPIKLVGKATAGDVAIERTASLSSPPGETAADEMLLAIAIPTPFTFSAPFETKYAPRGSIYTRRYRIDRGGFNGPIEIRLADIQARHLQGVTGPKIIVPPGKTEFEFSISLPPWMEIGRTSRTCLMAVGVVEDSQGKKHKVSYSSVQSDDQMIVLVDPGRLSVETRRKSIRGEPSTEITIPIHIGRANDLKGSVRIELLIPKHIKGVSSLPGEIPSNADDGDLRIRFETAGLGPFNMPLTVLATIRDERGLPVVAECKVDVVSDK